MESLSIKFIKDGKNKGELLIHSYDPLYKEISSAISEHLFNPSKMREDLSEPDVGDQVLRVFVCDTCHTKWGTTLLRPPFLRVKELVCPKYQCEGKPVRQEDKAIEWIDEDG